MRAEVRFGFCEIDREIERDQSWMLAFQAGDRASFARIVGAYHHL